MAEAYRLIKEEYGEQRAQALFVSNQELLLAGWINLTRKTGGEIHMKE